MGQIRPPGSGRQLAVMTGFLLLVYAGFTLAPSQVDSSQPSPKSTHSMLKSVAASSGGGGGGTVYRISGTLGQPSPVGFTSTANNRLVSGFWAGARQPLSNVPEALRTGLGRNYPNPFNPQTTIPYFTARQTRVDLAVYDARGRKVRTLVQSSLPAGSHEVVWDGKDQFGRQTSTGVYFLRLSADGKISVRKMVLVK